MERGCAWVACIPWVLLVAAAVGRWHPALSGEDFLTFTPPIPLV